MTLSGLILKFMQNHIKLAELVCHTQRQRNVPFSEHVLFVQICPVFAGLVTNCWIYSPDLSIKCLLKKGIIILLNVILKFTLALLIL